MFYINDFNIFSYYKCAKSTEFFCDGTARKNVDGTFSELKPHSRAHIANRDDESNLIVLFRDALKERSKNENISLKLIYDDEAQRHRVAAGLYPGSTAESIMRSVRRSSLPALPQSLHELAVKFDNGDLSRYMCCNNSIFSGSVRDSDGKYSVILACRHLIKLVLSHGITEVHADATFKVVPANMGSQLLSIHFMMDNVSIPAYTLMETKSRNWYQCVMDYMKNNLFPNLSPSLIMTDFEPALRDALSSSVGVEGTRVLGCWFHHNQAVWKKMKSLNYLETVNSNTYALKTLQILMCLPLLPSAEIEQGFLLTKAYAIHHNVPLTNLFEYYQNYWIRRVGVNIISVNGVSRRTNNNLESFHNFLRHKFSIAHPNLWVFLGQICELSQKYHTTVTQISNGLQPTRNIKTKYLLNSRLIKRAVEHHGAGLLSVWQFLVKCSYSCAGYERRQRHWALGIEHDHESNDDVLEDDFVEPGPEVPQNAPEVVHNPRNCMVCLTTTPGENVAQHIVLPCGHAWVCETCVSVLDGQHRRTCPVCRGDVLSFQRMFLS
ncbi:unnamed protein product [Macrosiphum euphorbiae]|uniref:RING-type domain-containing protein n=1 Tax=Macrosiphum euphorbiae TaxID=13131 RepID=A0AAV0XMD8_9HEMI|nr:unnamed protein product [Macrosiphum euphorbiae]